MPPIKAAIYTRLSEEDRNKQNPDDDSKSIQNQKTMLIQYAMEHGWEIFEIYSDDDYTGADRHRPQFLRLLSDAEARKFDIILCKTQSRFTRELEIVEKYIHGLFPVWGIRFVSIVDNADTANRGNKKARQINGLINEWYLEDMSENIRSVLTSRRKNGFFIGAFAPYGYKKDPNQKGHLIPDPEAALIVREIFSLFSKGYGKTAIARLLNDRGVPNPSAYKRLHGLHYQNSAPNNSALWKYYTISDILKNAVYIGNLIQGKYESISYKSKVCRPRDKDQWIIIEGAHEAIITPELWNQVQMMIAVKAKPFHSGQIGIFARKDWCADCGYTLRSTKSRGRYYLQCQTRHVAEQACKGAFIPVNELEQIILQQLHCFSEKYLDQGKLERSIQLHSDLELRKKKILADIAAYQKRVDEYSKGLKELYLDKVRGILNEDDFSSLSADFSEEKARLEGMLEIERNKLFELEQKHGSGGDTTARLTKLTEPNHLTRQMVDYLIDYIIVGRRNGETHKVPIEIHWKF